MQELQAKLHAMQMQLLACGRAKTPERRRLNEEMEQLERAHRASSQRLKNKRQRDREMLFEREVIQAHRLAANQA